MLSARSVKKLLILFTLVVPMTFAASEARRAYQTVDKQDVLDASDMSDSARAPNDNTNEFTSTSASTSPSKRQALPKATKQDKQARQTQTKTAGDKQQAAAEQPLTSPLDVMMQFEKDREAGSENQVSTTSKPSSSKVLNTTKTVPATKKKAAAHDKIIKVMAPVSIPITEPSWPYETAITALAIGVCLYAFSKKFLFRENLKSTNFVKIGAHAGNQISPSINAQK